MMLTIDALIGVRGNLKNEWRGPSSVMNAWIQTDWGEKGREFQREGTAWKQWAVPGQGIVVSNWWASGLHSLIVHSIV